MTELAGRVDILRRVGIFSGCTDEELQGIATRCTDGRAAAGEVIVKKGEPGYSLYVVAEGTVRVEIAGSGSNSKAFEEHGPGLAFGELALLLDDGRRSATVEALTDVQLLRLQGDEFRRLLLSNPAIGLRVAQLLARRLVDFRDRDIGLYVSKYLAESRGRRRKT